MSTVSDMVLARNELARRLRESATDVPVDGAFERLSSIIAEMRDAITRTRMQRIENLFVGLPRMVRDLSAELGKQVLVDIEGGDVELDREMIEMIRDPLTHIIRNAVDHGIEKPAERLKAGKREIGILAVSARQSGNQILIDIQDDGRGIDGKRLVEKAVSAGIVDEGRCGAAIAARAAGADLRGRPFDRQGGHLDLRPRRRHGRRPLEHRADRRHRRGRQQARRGNAHDPARAADADHHSGADGVDRRPAFRDSALGDRRDRSRQRRERHARASRRRRCRDHSRPPRSRSLARRNSRPRQRGRASRTAP